MKAKLISLLLAAVLLCALIPVQAFAATVVASGSTNGTTVRRDTLSWSLNSDGVLTVSGRGDMGSFETESHSGSNAPWSAYADRVTAIVVSEGVTGIGEEAFKALENVSSLALPKSLLCSRQFAFPWRGVGNVHYAGDLSDWLKFRFVVTSDSEYVSSRDCAMLGYYGAGGRLYLNGALMPEEITIPADCREIGECAFYGVQNLQRVTTRYGLERIGKYAFANCTNLSAVDLPDSLTELGFQAFYGCTSLTELKTPVRLTSVELSWLPNLTSLNLSESVTHLDIYGLDSLQTLVLPPRLKSLSITQCGVTELTVPDGVALSTCSSCPELGILNLPERMSSMPDIGRCPNLKTVRVPEGVKVIDSWTFNGCSALESIELPQSLLEIAVHGFEGSSALQALVLPDAVAILRQYAFKDCSSLASIEIGKQITTIESLCFSGCSALTSIRFRGAAPYFIASDAFQNVSATVYYPSGDPSWTSAIRQNYGGNLVWQSYSDGAADSGQKTGRCGDNLTWSFSADNATLTIRGTGAMYNYISGWAEDSTADWSNLQDSTAPWRSAGDRIRHIVIENGVTSIGSYAFGGLTALESVSFPSSLSSIGDCAFTACGLTAITLPAGISEIPYGCFYRSDRLSSIIIPNNITRIGNIAFAWCDSLESVRFSDSVTEIGALAFEGCTSLDNVVLPQFLTRLRSSVFEGCGEIPHFTLGNNIEVLEDRCLFQCSLPSLVIPASVKSIDSTAFGGVQGLDADGDTPIGELYFEGDMPAGAKAAFENTTVSKLYYPAGKSQSGYQLSSSGVSYAIWVPGGAPIDACVISLDKNSYVYDGTARKPAVSVSYHGELLTEDTYYTLLYKNNINAGTASVTVTGKGSFYGTKTLTFEIAPSSASLSFAKSNVEVETGSGPFTNKLTSKTDGTIVFSSSNTAVATVNASTGQVTPKKAGSTTIWAKASAGKNYKAMSMAYNLTVKSSKTYSFSISDFSYSFGNSSGAFGYYNGYRIPYDRYRYFFPSSRASAIYNKEGSWDGSCYGMAATAGLFNVENSGLSLSAFNASRISALSPNTRSRNTSMTVGSTVRDMIEYAFVSQFAYQVQSCYIYNTNLTDVCDTVNQISKTGQPVIIAIWGPKSGGHALLAYSIQRVNSSTSRMYVYDCNFPGRQRYITLYTDSRGNYTGWYYHLNDAENWGSAYGGNSSISAVPYARYSSAWFDRESNRTNLLMTAAQNFEICDYAGNWIATMRDGDFISSDPSVFAFKPVDIETADNSNLLYLPTNTYQIINTDPTEELELWMTDLELSSAVRTDTDVIMLTVDDDDDCNMVYLSTEDGDGYDVTLSSEMEDSSYDEMNFTGTGDGSVIQIGMHNGELILANCPDIQINGAARQRSLKDCQARLEYLQVKGDGTEKRPSVTINDGARTLELNVDYTLSYVSNVNVGTATVAVYGKGLYTGELFLSFEILATEPCASGHLWGERELLSAPTLAKDGLTRCFCSRCGRSLEENVPAYAFETADITGSKIELNVHNNMKTTLEGVCFVTAYDTDGAMLSSAQYLITIDAEDSTMFSFTTPFGSAVERAFILDRETLAPLGMIWEN